MLTHKDKATGKTIQAVSHRPEIPSTSGKSAIHLRDNRPQSVVQKKQAETLATRGVIEARALHQKKEKVKPTIQVKATPNVNNDKGSKVIQCAIQVNPIIYVPLSPADIAKIVSVTAHLNASLANDPSLITNVDIMVVNHLRGTNPANTLMINPTVIQVNLADWFVRISSVGEISALIAHEIGVHTLADARMGLPARAAEATGNRAERIVTGLHTHDLAITNPRDDREKDHVNVVKDTGRGPQPTRPRGGPNMRTRVYVNTMLALGDAIEAHATLTPPQKDKQLQDLLSTFLFDYARLLATDDGGGLKVFAKAYLISQVINWYRTTVIRRYSAAHPWLTRPALQPTSSGWGLRAYLLLRVSAWLLDRLRSGRVGTLAGRGATGVANIGRATGRMIGAVARPLAPVGNLIGRVAGPAARRAAGSVAHAGGSLGRGIGNLARPLAPVGRMAGNVIGATLRAADHVAGETENLAQNVIGLGASLVSGAVGLGASAVSGLWGFGKSMLGR